jgi:hypothetical protein
MPRIPLTREQCELAFRAIRSFLTTNPDPGGKLALVLKRLNTGVNTQVKACIAPDCAGEMEFVNDAFYNLAEGKPRPMGGQYQELEMLDGWICAENPRHVEIA